MAATDFTASRLQDDLVPHVMDTDNLTDQWFLTRTYYPMLTVLLTYWALLKLGPSYMADKTPYNLKNVMRIYNLVQMVLNASFIYRLMVTPNVASVIASTICSLEGHEQFEDLKQIFMNYFWFYFVLKMMDLLDTVFMVLRKKNSHITFLHVYHHTCMVFFTWITLKYIKSHHGIIPGFINVTVHVIMYSYYFLATFSRLKPYLWWKQHITKLQLGQFAIILMYMSTLYYKGCQIPRLFTLIWIFNVSVIFVFFVNFYVKSYVLASEDQTPARARSKRA